MKKCLSPLRGRTELADQYDHGNYGYGKHAETSNHSGSRINEITQTPGKHH